MIYPHLIIHVPHSATDIPERYKDGICISEADLWREQCRLTDAFCDELFAPPEIISSEQLIRAQISRLICDVERFRDDKDERMSWRGMGLMYTRTTFGRKLRSRDAVMRQRILDEIYDPHHMRFTSLVDQTLESCGRCTILDGHSFNSRIPFNFRSFFGMPDVCIGTDAFHTPHKLCNALVKETRSLGYTVSVNTPFAGSIVPMKHYHKDKRILSVMIELNRRLYENERDMTKSAGYAKTQELVKRLMRIVANF